MHAMVAARTANNKRSKPQMDAVKAKKVARSEDSEMMDQDHQEDAVPSTTEVIEFAKKLASNKKEEREKTLMGLRAWLKVREKAAGTFKEIELLKLWKGLFYCLWMADKVPVQQQLSEDLAQLVHVFKKKANAAIFIRTFYQTMLREWPGLDKWRIDKFYSLVRYFFRETLLWMQKKSCVELWGCVLRDDLLMHKPNGMRLHVADIFLDEVLRTETDANLDTEKLQEILSPFYCVLGSCDSDSVVRHVLKVVFNPIPTDRPLKNLDIKATAKSIFALAADAEDISDAQREMLYDTYDLYRQALGASAENDQDILMEENAEEAEDDEIAEDQDEDANGDDAHRDLREEFEQIGEASSDEEEAAVEQAKKHAKASTPGKGSAKKKVKAVEEEEEENVVKTTTVTSAKKVKKSKSTPQKQEIVVEELEEKIQAAGDEVTIEVKKTIKKSPKGSEKKAEAKQLKAIVEDEPLSEVEEEIESASAKKLKKSAKKASAKKSKEASDTLPPLPPKASKSALKKRIRFSLESTQALDHRVSMKRLKTTPVKPASKQIVPSTGLLKVKNTPEPEVRGQGTAQSEPRKRTTLKQGLADARKNTILNSAVKPRRRQSRPRAEDFF